MSAEADDNALLDGIAELMLLPIQTGQTKKVEAQITVELDEKDGKVKLSASINSAEQKKWTQQDTHRTSLDASYASFSVIL